MTGAPLATPADTDTNKTLKTKCNVLKLTDHQWALTYIKQDLMAKDLYFEGMFKKGLQTSYFLKTKQGLELRVAP